MISVKLLTFYYEQCNRNHFSTSLVQCGWRRKKNCEETERNTQYIWLLIQFNYFFFHFSLGLTHAVNTPETKNDFLLGKLIMYVQANNLRTNNIFFDTFDRSDLLPITYNNNSRGGSMDVIHIECFIEL